jgi:glycosyltransferase involved in cell wall biosynthesis
MKKKKIICTVTNDLNYDQRMHRICGSLAGAGYDVELLGRRRRSSSPLPPRSFRQTRLFCYFEKGKFFYLEYNLRLFIYLLGRRFDVVCAVDLDTIAPAWAAGRLKGAGLIYDAHEYFTEVPEVVGRRTVKRIWEWVGRFFIPRMDRCYTVGPALAGLLSREYGKPFEVIRNLPLRREAEAGRDKPGKPVFLYQGALNEGRGLEALFAVLPAFPEAEVWLAGEGDLSEALRRRAAEMGLADRIRFLGYVLPADLPALTRQATIGFNLLENKGLSYYYSLANKAFDYIQEGLPSVQMDFPEYRALQEQYGVFQLVPDLSPDTLTAAIRALLEDQAHYDRIRRACLKAAGELVWEKEEARLLAIYAG